MIEPRKKKKHPNAIVIPILLVLISSVLVFNGRVWSNESSTAKNIIFNNQTWNMVSGPFDQTWKTNSDRVIFKVDLSQDFNKAQLQELDVAQPFEVTANNNQITPRQIANPDFAGVYEVEIPVTEDGELNVTVSFLQNNSWGITEGSYDFSITRDATAPKVKISGIENNVLTDKEVNVDIEVFEQHFDTNSVTIEVSKNNKPYELSEWGNKGETTINTFNFTEEGEYILSVQAKDEYGNISTREQLAFAIRTKAPVLTVFAGEEQLTEGEISKASEVVLKVASKIKLDNAKVTITKESGTETIEFPGGDWETILNYPVTEEGLYVFKVEVEEAHTMGRKYTLPTFTFTADHVKPGLTITGVDEGEKDDKDQDVIVTVDDIHFDSGKLEVKVQDIDGNEKTTQVTLENGETTFTAEEDGKYTLTATAVDKAGNPADTRQVSFTVDKKQPILSISEDVNGKFFKEDKELKFTVKDLTFDLLNTVLLVKKGFEPYVIGELAPSLFKAEVTHKFTQDGRYGITLSSTDGVGLSGSISPVTFTIDKTPPVIRAEGVEKIETPEGENDPKKYHELAVTITDDNSDWENTTMKIYRNDEELSIVTGENVANTHVFKEDGKYDIQIVAADKAGNQTSHETISFTVDNTPPKMFISGVENGAYYQKLENLQLSIEDLTFQLKETTLEILKDGAAYEVDGAWEEIRSKGKLYKAIRKLSFDKDGKYEISLTTKDLFGNTNKLGPIKFTIDNTDPEFLVVSDPVDEHLKVNRVVKVTLDEINPDWEKTILNVTRNGFKYDEIKGEEVIKEAGHIFSEDGNYVLYLKATDKAENEKIYEQMKFTIDKSQPELEIDGVEDGGYYQKLENLELSIEDLTFLLKDAKLVVKKNGEPLEKLDGTWDESYTEGGLKRAIRKLSFDQDGDYEISLTVNDLLGNDATLGPIKFTIDATDPVISFDGIDEGAFVQKDKKAKVIVNERNFDKDKVKITVTKDQEKYEGTWNYINSLFEHTFVADGDYEVVVEAEDKAGNKATQKKLTFTVDNVEPVIEITGAKNNSYYNDGKKVEIEVEELNFKNNSVDIQVTRKIEVDGSAIRFPIGEWKNVSKVSDISYLFDEDGEYEIIVNAMDAAENLAIEKKLLFTIDQVAPELRITGVEDDHNYSTDKPVNVKVSDRNFDLSQTNLKVKKDNKEYRIGDPELKSLTSAEKEFTFKEEGSYVINLDTVDKAGNKKVHDQIAFIIDKTNPIVKIDGAKNNSFNPENKNVTISIDELNFKTNNVSIIATKEGSAFNIGNWDNNGKLSKLGYNFNRDGLYTILATAEDKAGNGPISEKMTFTIDKTKPEIEITGVDNNAYYNVDKPVNVSIKDVNLDINRINVTRNGAPYNTGGFSVNGDLASFRHNFSGEGEYNIVVEATDKAGNSFSEAMKFTIDKTKPVITPKFKGQNRVIKNGEYINEVFTPEFALDEAEDMIVSATLNNGGNLGKNIPVAAREMSYTYKVLARDKAGNESTIEISFTLDTTKPMLNISGVLDGFFNKDIAPKVTYSDVHLDQNKTSVTLNGRPFENGTKLEYEQDYILKAVVTDLAKNVSSRTIVFTIDKTSPVIKFKEPISNQYFNTDLLPQLLIEDMSSYDIIAMMLDGKPYEAGDPIKEEGKHVMFFEVKDKAGNIQQLSVEFIIDKTAPKVVYEGVKNKEKYYDPVDIAIRLDNPNDKIKSVMINGEMFEGDVVEENGYKVIKTTLAEIKPYEIAVTASDEAGNEKKTVIAFEIVKKGALVKFYENKPLLGGTLAGVIGLVAAATTVLIRRRRMKLED
jgi:large repetitive protein